MVRANRPLRARSNVARTAVGLRTNQVRRGGIVGGSISTRPTQSPAGDNRALTGPTKDFFSVFFLALLVEKSLVVAEDGPLGTRYRLLETMGQ